MPTNVLALPASGTIGASIATTTALTATIAVDFNGADMGVVFFTYGAESGDVTGISPSSTPTYNGVPLTPQLTGVMNTGSGLSGSGWCYTIANPSPGTNNLIIVFPIYGAGANHYLTVEVAGYTGVGSIGNKNSVATFLSTTTSPALAVTCSTGNVVIGGIFHGDSINAVAHTQRGAFNNFTNHHACGSGVMDENTGSGSVAVSASSSIGDSWVAMAIELVAAPLGPTHDASSPARVSTNTASTVTTAAFTPPVGSRMVALVGLDGNTGTDTVTDSGSGGDAVTWAQYAVNSTLRAQIWISSPCPTAISRTVNYANTIPSRSCSLKVEVFTNVRSSGSPVGGTDNGTGANTTNNVTPAGATTTEANTVLLVSAVDDRTTGVAVSSDLIYDSAVTSAITPISGYKAVTTAGATTMNLDASGTGAASWTWCSVELLGPQVAFAPSTPAVPTVEPRANALFATVVPPADGGSAITDYIWEYNDGSGWNTFSDGTSTTPSVTITGLTRYLSTQVRVSAVNAIGTSSASTASTGVSPYDLMEPMAFTDQNLEAWSDLTLGSMDP